MAHVEQMIKDPELIIVNVKTKANTACELLIWVIGIVEYYKSINVNLDSHFTLLSET